MHSEQLQFLRTYLREQFPDWEQLDIIGLTDLSAGWESIIYTLEISFHQDGEPETRSLILRIYPGDDALEKSRHEFHGMHLLHQIGYPVPHVYILEDQPSSIGKAFMLMEFIQGDVMWHLIDNSSIERREELLHQFCQLVVQLHNLNWRPFVKTPNQIENGLPYLFIDRWIKVARRIVGEFGKEEFLPVVEWVAQKRDKMGANKPSVIHNDFHPANVLVTPKDAFVVIDWTGWQVTDYRFDLAWTLLLARAYGNEQLSRNLIVAYEEARGEEVTHIEYFEVCACARRLFDVTTSLTIGAERLGMRPETVETMRSQIGHLRIVYELLREHTRLQIPQVEYLLTHDGKAD